MIGALTLLVLAAPTWSVELVAAGPQKIEVIKRVRASVGLRLKEAKDLVEAAPTIVKSHLEKGEAEALAAQLREAGATARLTEAPPPRTAAQYTVTVTAGDPKPEDVWPVLRDVLGLGQQPAQSRLRLGPMRVDDLDEAQAQAIADRIRKLGATVKVSGPVP